MYHTSVRTTLCGNYLRVAFEKTLLFLLPAATSHLSSKPVPAMAPSGSSSNIRNSATVPTFPTSAPTLSSQSTTFTESGVAELWSSKTTEFLQVRDATIHRNLNLEKTARIYHTTVGRQPAEISSSMGSVYMPFPFSDYSDCDPESLLDSGPSTFHCSLVDSLYTHYVRGDDRFGLRDGCEEEGNNAPDLRELNSWSYDTVANDCVVVTSKLRQACIFVSLPTVTAYKGNSEIHTCFADDFMDNGRASLHKLKHHFDYVTRHKYTDGNNGDTEHGANANHTTNDANDEETDEEDDEHKCQHHSGP